MNHDGHEVSRRNQACAVMFSRSMSCRERAAFVCAPCGTSPMHSWKSATWVEECLVALLSPYLPERNQTVSASASHAPVSIMESVTCGAIGSVTYILKIYNNAGPLCVRFGEHWMSEELRDGCDRDRRSWAILEQAMGIPGHFLNQRTVT